MAPSEWIWNPAAAAPSAAAHHVSSAVGSQWWQKPKPPLMETEPQSRAQINTWNQAANSRDNSRVSERKHFVKQTVCCLIAVFSHLHSLSQQLSLMWRWSGLGCSGQFFLVVVIIFCHSIKTESLGKTHTEKRNEIRCINVRIQTSCMHVQWQSSLCLGALLKETFNDAVEMILQPIC